MLFIRKIETGKVRLRERIVVKPSANVRETCAAQEISKAAVREAVAMAKVIIVARWAQPDSPGYECVQITYREVRIELSTRNR